MLSNTNKNDIIKLFKTIKKNDEFEIMFNNYRSDNVLSLINFMNVLKYIRFKSETNNMKLIETVTLDINYNEYRITVSGLNTINNLLGLLYQKKNHNLFSIIISQYLDKDGFKLIQKIKEKADKIDIDSLDIRVRKAKEIPVTDSEVIKKLSKLTPSDSDMIQFRYKQRISLEIFDDLHIDMTQVRFSDNVTTLMSATKSFELEMDYSPSSEPDEKKLNIMFDEMVNIKKVMNNSDIIISKEEEKEIIEKYVKLTYGNIMNDNINILYTMQPISAEVQHIIDIIPNRYNATDKADGEKYQLFVHDNNTYMISNNLHVKKLNMPVKDMNDTIVEGELIYLSEKRIYIFMMFDCLYYKGEEIKTKVLLKDRLKPLEQISNGFKCSPYIVKEYEGKFNLSEMKKHYNGEIKKFYGALNNEISRMKTNEIIIYPKLFIYPTGGSPSEVFMFSDIIWNNCTKNTDINCPYVLDGIIFTPMEQKYTREKKEQKFNIYKYKPPQTNSLDVYITFEKNKDTGGYMDIFDNSLPFKSSGVFRVVNLLVGEVTGGRELPVPFMKEENNNIIYLPIVDGHIRDVEGNLIMDKTVVEIIYTNDTTVPHQYRWTIL
jgi:hypothetical protein